MLCRVRMDMSARPAAPTHSVPPRVAALSILLFWTIYFLSISARAMIRGYPGYESAFDNRAMVAIAGMGFTWLLYLRLRRFDGRRLAVRVTAAFLASVPVAIAYAAVNYASFYVYDPMPPEFGTAKAKMREGRPEKRPTEMVADNSLHWYFFILSWAALYLALSYAGAVKASEREAARLRAAAQAAELRALRYQVNPHFLFNTLNSISSLVMSGRTAQAEAMILNLSRFFRASLSADPTDDVRLADEIAMQRLYLEIEAARFPDRLRPEIEVEPGLEEACVPGMILQPLIENAVKYGVAPARRPVTVRINAHRARGELHLKVEDDGGAPDRPPVCDGTGVGLRNVGDRLKVRFGDRAEIRCGRRDGGGFAVGLSMPLVLRDC